MFLVKVAGPRIRLHGAIIDYSKLAFRNKINDTNSYVGSSAFEHYLMLHFQVSLCYNNSMADRASGHRGKATGDSGLHVGASQCRRPTACRGSL